MVNCRSVSAHACWMSKILLLFYRNFGLDQGRGKLADEKYQRREAGVVQDRFSLEPAREVEIFLGFAFQPSESM